MAPGGHEQLKHGIVRPPEPDPIPATAKGLLAEAQHDISAPPQAVSYATKPAEHEACRDQATRVSGWAMRGAGLGFVMGILLSTLFLLVPTCSEVRDYEQRAPTPDSRRGMAFGIAVIGAAESTCAVTGLGLVLGIGFAICGPLKHR